MKLDSIATLVLDAAEGLDLETRFEEKTDRKTGILSTNASLRAKLGGREQPYPGSAERCDVAFEVDGLRIWLEVKHSWTWSTYKRPSERNGAYTKHLFGTDAASSLHDARTKLPRLIGQPGVDAIAMLVIALGSTALPHSVDDIQRLARSAQLDVAPWTQFDRLERASRVLGYETIRVRPYLWIRPASSVATKRAARA
jgi:hypothetical protein